MGILMKSSFQRKLELLYNSQKRVIHLEFASS